MENLFITIIAVTFVLIAYIVFFYNKTKVPFVSTPKGYFPGLFREIKITPETVIYDLGSGSGNFLLAAAKYKPRKLVGFEISPWHVFCSRWRAAIKNIPIKIVYGDFFKADISEADIVYIFLVSDIVNKIWQKIKQQCRAGTLVIILSDQVIGEKPEKVVSTPSKTKYYFYRL